jgi:hypothetical protein
MTVGPSPVVTVQTGVVQVLMDGAFSTIVSTCLRWGGVIAHATEQ